MKALKNMKIGKKLRISFIVIVALFVIAVTAGVISIHIISSNMSEFYTEQFQIAQTSQTLKTDLQGYAKNLARVYISTQPMDGLSETERKEYNEQKVAELDKFFALYGTDLEALSNLNVTSQDEMSILNENYPILQELTQQVKDLYAAGKFAEGYQLATVDIEDAGYASGVALDGVIEKAQQDAKDKYDQTQVLVDTIYVILVVISVILLIAAVTLCVLITRSIVRPLSEMENAAKKLSEGKLDQTIKYESENEIGSLAGSLRATIETMRSYIGEIDRGMNAIGNGRLNYHTLTEFKGDFKSIRDAMNNISANLTSAMIQINTSAEQVMRGAEQIAGSGQALSQATLEQASSVEELGATINEVSTRINENAQNAMSTSKLTEALGIEVNESSEQMKNMSHVMKQMKDMSADITGIIKDIEDIAFQTNILSLNAAVEAARAGEAGKGFSVVANEIRRLSAKTTEASKTTSELINQTVQMMVDGSDMADKTSGKLQEVVKATQEAAQNVDMISRASNDQATAVVQLRQSIAMISDIVQENSATAEESAASSEELTGQMQMLKELVGAFEYDE
ncbi:MAG: methyl-accepting chemotaxis protein [Clostridia bacterium]|nr:methyl-accepting chemotaxis protein [Clostridia bacterium]NCC42633.1 methyl-accepting chemotaxis protein [Clostridia bacterium]